LDTFVSGYAVALAATGTAALVETATATPAAIVLDQHLPDIAGLEWLRLVRQRQQDLEPPVLLFTADWDIEDCTEELASLGATFASKLCDLDEVERLIDSLVALHGINGQTIDER
jgi:DNA-binding response OmpR family regulator